MKIIGYLSVITGVSILLVITNVFVGISTVLILAGLNLIMIQDAKR